MEPDPQGPFAELRLQDTLRLSAEGVAKVLGDLEAKVMETVWALVDTPVARLSIRTHSGTRRCEGKAGEPTIAVTFWFVYSAAPDPICGDPVPQGCDPCVPWSSRRPAAAAGLAR